jgi:exodeoxyribonuclease V alpha subunit
MDTVEGYIERIVFRNDENGYTVMSVNDSGTDVTVVGIFHYIGQGEYIRCKGEFKDHQIYGTQLSTTEYEMIQPQDEMAIIRYLGSGAIKGIKLPTATKIVNHFKGETFKIIENSPERLAEIKGISKKKALEIASQINEKKDMRDAMIFLGNYGISMTLAVKIYNYYGPEIYNVIKVNPYRIADDIKGVGFKIADEIARKAGISSDSDFRIKSGIVYALQEAAAGGNVYLPYEDLEKEAIKWLGIDDLELNNYLDDLSLEKRIIVKEKDDNKFIYETDYYYTELGVARRLMELNIHDSIDEKKIRRKLSAIEDKEGVILDEKQEEAVIEAIKNGLLVITGGPGTGKTTTIKTIIKFFESEKLEIRLAAPTGRAAKRMTETTGYEAQTIHRMLEVVGNPEDKDDSGRFERNQNNPLEADLIIIDEMSMVDIFLMNALLKAISVGTRLILVGDVNQLPSVGPGNVLKDIINSDCFNVVRLDKIFRQAATSDIVMDAHKINKGEKVDLAKKSKDFLFIKGNDNNNILNTVLILLKDKLPKYVNSSISDIQVLTPTRIGALGVESLNNYLQMKLNPPGKEKHEVKYGEITFREGDKVMQIKNDYQMEWEIQGKYGIAIESGKGVFNGDVGKINTINSYTEYVEVEFEEKKIVTYTFKQLEELELAYAVTIHKSQGSEYPAVIIPMFTGPRMLLNRNLLYTAVTRAKKCVCMVGDPSIFYTMVNNDSQQIRHSGLKYRIKEMKQESNI